LGAKDNYLLVITFKDLYVGNGQDFYNSIAKEKLDNIVNGYEGTQWIPFRNMYFLSIDDLDIFVQGIKDGKMKLTEEFRKAVEADTTPSSKKFVFRQHISSDRWAKAVPQYLKDEFENIFGHLFMLFGQDMKSSQLRSLLEEPT
jgi:hypothetical protein